MIHALLAAFFFVISLPGNNALADGSDVTDASLPSDERMVVLPYDESDIYTLTTRFGFQTSVIFARDEEVETISVGDRSLWQIIPSGQRLFIRPMVDGLVTNMTVITNRRSYHFDLKSLPEDSEEKPVYVVRFHYPDAKPSASTKPAFLDDVSKAPEGFLPDHSATARSSLNYNYTYTGSDEIAPVKVHDDGQTTFFTYRSTVETPRVFVVSPGQPEREVSYTARGNELMVEEIAGEFILRHSGGSVHVYNEVLNPR
ncbi:MAG: TrbG/VirB9 family P-type conjugative transfer protein [Alphaproteobacteria bacterium]|nr:TrbG/VirB9 family P-type conjugative transfer protein [Alphaproteobacteria bacterium]